MIPFIEYKKLFDCGCFSVKCTHLDSKCEYKFTLDVIKKSFLYILKGKEYFSTDDNSLIHIIFLILHIDLTVCDHLTLMEYNLKVYLVMHTEEKCTKWFFDIYVFSLLSSIMIMLRLVLSCQISVQSTKCVFKCLKDTDLNTNTFDHTRELLLSGTFNNYARNIYVSVLKGTCHRTKFKPNKILTPLVSFVKKLLYLTIFIFFKSLRFVFPVQHFNSLGLVILTLKLLTIYSWTIEVKYFNQNTTIFEFFTINLFLYERINLNCYLLILILDNFLENFIFLTYFLISCIALTPFVFSDENLIYPPIYYSLNWVSGKGKLSLAEFILNCPNDNPNKYNLSYDAALHLR